MHKLSPPCPPPYLYRTATHRQLLPSHHASHKGPCAPTPFQVALKSFVDANDSPACSPNYGCPADDPLPDFLAMLRQGAVLRDPMWLLLLLKVGGGEEGK